MIQLFQQTFKLNIAMGLNEKIYYLRKIPFVKKIIPGDLYGSEAINNTLVVLNYISKTIKELIIQIVFLLLFIIFPGMNSGWTGNMNVMSFLFPITLFAAFFYNPLFKVSEEMYYTIVLLKVDANKYAMMNLTQTLIKKSVLSMLILFICSLVTPMNMIYCLLYPAYYISFKIIVGYILLTLFEKTGILYNDKRSLNILSVILMLLMIAGLIFVKATWGISISDVYYCLFIAVMLPITYICYGRLLKMQSFKSVYKKKLVWENLVLKATDETEMMKKSVADSLSVDIQTDNSKHGFSYLNSIFFNRHRKILLTASIRYALIYSAIFTIITIALLVRPEFNSNVTFLIQSHMSVSLIVMYYTNQGSKVVQAMFVNCDRSMLNYRFYRQRSVILSFFVQRLKTVVRVNLIPSFVISVGICVLLWISSPAIEWKYFALIFISINSLSILFSIHHLMLYYLLQPYNSQLQAKGYLYNTLNIGMYILCYQMFRFEVPLLIFTGFTIIFCIVYSVTSLILVFSFAPQTFKIKK